MFSPAFSLSDVFTCLGYIYPLLSCDVRCFHLLLSCDVGCFHLLLACDVGQFCRSKGLMFPPLIHQGFGRLARVAKNQELEWKNSFSAKECRKRVSCVLPSGDNTIIPQFGLHLLPLINLKGRHCNFSIYSFIFILFIHWGFHWEARNEYTWVLLSRWAEVKVEVRH